MKSRIDWMGIGMFLLVLLFAGSITLGVFQYNHSIAAKNTDMELSYTTQTGVNK